MTRRRRRAALERWGRAGQIRMYGYSSTAFRATHPATEEGQKEEVSLKMVVLISNQGIVSLEKSQNELHTPFWLA